MKKFAMLFTLIAVVLFGFVGCGTNPGNSNTSRYQATTESIYDFYMDNIYKNSQKIGDVVNNSLYETQDDKLQATQVLTSLNQLQSEEVIIIATIQCFNSKNNPKVEYLDFDGMLVFVEQKSPGYNAKLTYKDSMVDISIEYSNILVSKGSTNVYDITFENEVVDDVTMTRSASVEFDSANSYLKINYSMTMAGVQVQTCKETIAYRNNEIASRYTIYSSETSGSWQRCLIDSYTTTFKTVAKLSKLKAAEALMGVADLSTSFVKASTNDKAGYMYNYDSSSNMPSYVVTKMSGSWLD